jgi:hypothetical protein
MRVTIKSIIKWGLLAEVLTAIVGQVGEFTLRYRAYSAAFDELFGHYRLPGHEVNRSLPLTSSSSLSKFDSMTKNISSAPPFEEFALDAGATTTIKRKGSSKSGQPRSSNDLDRRELQKKESQKLTATTEFPSFTRNSSSSSFSVFFKSATLHQTVFSLSVCVCGASSIYHSLSEAGSQTVKQLPPTCRRTPHPQLKTLLLLLKRSSLLPSIDNQCPSASASKRLN